jgi:hypothetical protein
MQHLRFRLLAATLPFLLASPPVFAQQPAPPTREEATAALKPASVAFTRQQLDQMLAPIALYPDQLLTALLMAATFPPQIVDAGKWLQDSANAALKGDALAAALEPLPWDPSVKSLVPFPQVVVMMNDHLDWTEALGAAFANQQIEVMARIQFLRDRAVAAGHLKSTPQIAVSGGASDIIIEPVDPSMIYLPVYNPAEAYGDWPDRDYPPVYIPPPPNFTADAIGAGIGFSVGFGVVRPLWGWGHPDWRRHEVVVDRGRFTTITNATNNTNNHIVIQNDTWRRTAPVVAVPDAQRPHPAAVAGPQPSGTVASTVVAHPGPGRGPDHTPGAAAPAARPSPAATGAAPAARPGEPPHPAAATQSPGPPSEQRHPAEAGRPAEPIHPGAEHHPGAPSNPAEAHPQGAPHPVEAHPAEGHPPGSAPHPAEAHPAEVHPPAPPPHPAAAASPALPHPAEVHPPAPPPHPAAAAPPPAQAHPPGPPPAAAHPPGKPPEKKPGDKPEHKPGEPDPEHH